MRTFNFRLFGVMLLGMALVSGTAYAVHEFQVKRNADVLLREAGLARERKAWGEAIDFLERYVVLVPKANAGPLAELGLLQADVRRAGDAYRSLEGALRQDSARDDVRRRLVEVAMSLERYPDARHHLEILLKASDDNGELYVLLARCQAATGEDRDAAGTLKRAIEKDPGRLDAYSLLAALLDDRLKDPAGATRVLDEMVANNSDTARAFVIRGTHRLKKQNSIPRENAATPAPTEDGRTGRESDERETTATADRDQNAVAPADTNAVVEALADARRALDLASDDEAVIGFGVRCLLTNDLHEEARELAQRGVELHPRSALMHSSAADVALKSGRRDEAIGWFRRGLEGVPYERDLLWNLSNLLIDEKQLSEAELTLEKLRRTGYPKPPITYLEARILVENGQWFDGSRRLESIRAALVGWPDLSKQADYHLGQCYEQLGRSDLQLTAFRRASGVDARWVPARLGVAGALLASGRVDEALEEYRQIAALPGAPAAVLAQLTRLLVLMNLRRNPSEQNWNTPNQLLDRLEAIDPEAPTVPVLRAEILVSQGQEHAAEELLTAARDKSPNALEFWMGLVALAERRGDAERAGELLNEAHGAIGDTVPIRLAQARHQANSQGAEAKDSLRELAKAADAFSADEQIALYSGLAGLTLAVGDYDETERLCTLVADEQPTNLRVRLLLFDLAFRAGRTASMERVLEQLQRIERSGPLWHYGEAVRLCVEAKDDNRPELYAKAKEHLTEARVARPAWSRLPLLLAKIDDLQKDEEAALSNFTQAINLGERDPAAIARAVDLLYRRGRFSQADLLIRRLQEQQSPFSSALTQLATVVSLRLNDNERALELVMKLTATSQDPAEHIWAGRMLGALGKNGDAEKRFREAIEQDKTAAAGWVALIQHLGRTAQVQKADEALSEAEKHIPLHDAPLALAEALESIGRLEEAEARYKAACDAAPDDVPLVRRLAEFYLRQRKFQEVEPLLSRLMSRADAMSDDDRLWCRRSMTLPLLVRGDQPSLKTALALIEENLAVDRESVADRRSKAMLLALLPDRESRVAAVTMLEKIIENDRPDTAEANAEARFALASIYLDLGDVPKGTGHLRKLMASHGDNLRYLTYYVQFLVSRKEIGEAELWLSQLVKLAPLEITTLAMTTEVEFAREGYDDILNSVDEYLGKFKGKEAERQERTRLAASLLETYVERLKKVDGDKPETAATRQEWAARFSQRTDALFRNYTEERPQEALALAAFYGRQGRHDESLDVLENNWSNARPEEIAAVTATLAKSPTATKAHSARAAQVLNAALEKHGRPLVLILALANLQNWGEQFAEAERLYREALAKDARNVGTLNNLALLLALRGRGGKEPLSLIQKAVEIAGPNPGLLDSRGTIYLLQGDTRLAADDLARALLKRPSAGGYFRQAQVELRLGHQEAARESFAKAGALGLRTEELHPLERPIYRQLKTELQ